MSCVRALFPFTHTLIPEVSPSSRIQAFSWSARYFYFPGAFLLSGPGEALS